VRFYPSGWRWTVHLALPQWIIFEKAVYLWSIPIEAKATADIGIVATVELSKRGKHKGKYFAIVDDEDFDRINQFNWFIGNGYAQRVVEKGNGKRDLFHMHRMVMNTPDGMMTDHINHDTLDNRKSNLRVCTRQQNAFNIKKKKIAASKYKGISQDRRDNSWNVRIGFNNKRIQVGWFKDEMEAAKAYDQKAKELFGDFAKLNFPTL